MNSDGEVLTRFRPTSVEVVQAAQARASLANDLHARLKKAADDAAAKAGLAILDALTSRRPPTLEQVDALAQTEGLDPRVAKLYQEGREAFVQKLNSGRVRSAMTRAFSKVRKGQNREEAFKQRDAELLELYREGVAFPATNRMAANYYSAVVGGALDAGDTATAKAAFAIAESALARTISSLKDGSRRKTQLEQQLAALKQRLEDAKWH